MIQFKEYLLDVNGYKACQDAREWNENRTLAQCWAECERGDWMMWLLSHAKVLDLKTLTKIKALQVEKIRHLLKDPRSISALDAAHAFGRGEISEQELSASAASAYDAASSASYAAAAAASASASASSAAAASAASASASAAYDAAYASASSASAYAAAYAAASASSAAARLLFLKECADIVRSVIPNIEIENVL